jgi:hypothetical protein
MRKTHVTTKNDKPFLVEVHGRRIHVSALLDDWIYAGCWWTFEERRRYFLAELSDGRHVELFDDGSAWWVSRIAD